MSTICELCAFDDRAGRHQQMHGRLNRPAYVLRGADGRVHLDQIHRRQPPRPVRFLHDVDALAKRQPSPDARARTGRLQHIQRVDVVAHVQAARPLRVDPLQRHAHHLPDAVLLHFPHAERVDAELLDDGALVRVDRPEPDVGEVLDGDDRLLPVHAGDVRPVVAQLLRQKRHRHAVDVARRGRRIGVEVRVRVHPDHRHVLAVVQVAVDGTDRNRVVASERDAQPIVVQHLRHLVRQVAAAAGHVLQLLHVAHLAPVEVERLVLDVAIVLDVQRRRYLLDVIDQTRLADGLRAETDALLPLALIERHADDSDALVVDLLRLHQRAVLAAGRRSSVARRQHSSIRPCKLAHNTRYS
uniref:Uncharacterized protein n=1 Tax=Anopheles atroparvus TaxID=41427 RepID=A0A182JA41_ANOAO